MGQAGSRKPSPSGPISSSWTGACQAWTASRATRRIRASYPAAAIVAFCSEHSPEVRDAFLLAGANGFVDKRDVRKLIAAVRVVAESRADPAG
jgi:DNA-binding NarL/FixJ family response regulator